MSSRRLDKALGFEDYMAGEHTDHVDKTRGPWIQTFTGKRFHPLSPRVEDIDVLDIAHALARICRYGGQPSALYSVAEHSVLVSRYVAHEYAREGLMHDAAEAYIGDILRPIKQLPMYQDYRKVERRLETKIAERFGLRRDKLAMAAVKEIDNRILVDEVQAIAADPTMYLRPGEWLDTLKPTGAVIRQLSHTQAKVEFLQRFRELFP